MLLKFKCIFFKVWDLRQKGDTPIFSIKQMEDYVSAMITNSDNKYLVCASGDGSLTTFNMPARKLHVQVIYLLSMDYFFLFLF